MSRWPDQIDFRSRLEELIFVMRLLQPSFMNDYAPPQPGSSQDHL
jgi:hypothetical protein